MIITIASGKGGTGKTTVAINLALALNSGIIADCDVEEPNAHIFLRPKIYETRDIAVFTPIISQKKCTSCGVCVEACEFNALAKIKEQLLFFPDLCMNCEACFVLCPEKAITEGKKVIGQVQLGKVNDTLRFVSGVLTVGVPRGIPIIEEIKREFDPQQTIIVDAPPGTACLVIETIADSNFCILVTEPTVFGLWDLRISVEVVRKLGIPFGVIINRANLTNNEQFLDDYLLKENIPVLMRIPFDRKIAEDYSRGIPLVNNPIWKKKFLSLFKSCEELVHQ